MSSGWVGLTTATTGQGGGLKHIFFIYLAHCQTGMATVNITPLVEFNWHDYQTQTKQFYGPQKTFLNLTDM